MPGNPLEMTGNPGSRAKPWTQAPRRVVRAPSQVTLPCLWSLVLGAPHCAQLPLRHPAYLPGA